MVLETTDREVIAQVIRACQQAGPAGCTGSSSDRAAFAQLFEIYKDRVYSIALRFSGDRAVAMDIAQDTFLKLFSCIQDFRGASSFDAWLYRLVVNRCLDHHRRGKRWLPIIESVEGVLQAFQFSGNRVPQDSVLEALLHTEKQGQIQAAIASLSPELRMVVILRYTESLPYEDIAQIVGCPPGTVASRLNRAHKILERRLSHLRTAPASAARSENNRENLRIHMQRDGAHLQRDGGRA
jgi:RNA polymerase sigma-70 factor, ECF subfamily